MLSIKEINLLQAQNEGLKKQNADLQKENAKLKEEIETRDNLIDHFRDEALYRATIASEYQKDKTKLEQTLQDIKDIIHEQLMWQGQLPQCELEILQKITKAESEE